MATESERGRLVPDPRLCEIPPKPTAESRFDRPLLALDIELAEMEDPVEAASINGCIVVCEITEERGRSDIQSCVALS